jgi:3-keto-disaccharide hydrolase
MRHLFKIVLVFCVMCGLADLLSALGGQSDGADLRKKIVGRWDLVGSSNGGSYPAWLEVKVSGYRTLVGSYVGQSGSARPVSKLELIDGRIHFAIPPQWESRRDDQAFSLYLDGETLKGETTDNRGQPVQLVGHRAPSLKRTEKIQWNSPVDLFNGTDLTGWKPRQKRVTNGWVVEKGVLVNKTPGNDLLTDQLFTDFQLKAEFRYPKGSNSGIYLRGRYEMQIEDNYGDEPESHKIGGIYGFLTPRINAGRKPGEWQSVEITLVGRMVSVILNGESVIDRQEIPGITGGALDSDEGKPGPIMLQGDHGPIEFRNLSIRTAQP